jgi:hypothetical protein
MAISEAVPEEQLYFVSFHATYHAHQDVDAILFPTIFVAA